MPVKITHEILGSEQKSEELHFPDNGHKVITIGNPMEPDTQISINVNGGHALVGILGHESIKRLKKPWHTFYDDVVCNNMYDLPVGSELTVTFLGEPHEDMPQIRPIHKLKVSVSKNKRILFD